MIGIRSVTYHLPNFLAKRYDIDSLLAVSGAWDKESYFLHTQRICLPPIMEPLELSSLDPLLSMCEISGIRWLNIPIKLVEGNNTELGRFALAALQYSGSIFVNILAAVNSQFCQETMYMYAKLNHQTGWLDNTGQNNFRLGLSFNVEGNGPFFPFTFADVDNPSFTIGLELVREFNEIISFLPQDNPVMMREKLLEAIIPQIDEIYDSAVRIAKKQNMEFKGFDFSLAPEIGELGSIVPMLNCLGVYSFGNVGTMFATAFWTDILKFLAGRYPSVGFSGVMYSLLEDLDLCAINNERGISMEQLIMLSTMCGCGLDMVPISGDTSPEEIYALCLDIAGISCRLNKPLGIRLLPIPGIKRGQRAFTAVSGDADFIANTRVVPLNTNMLADVGNNFSFVRYGK